MELPNSPHTATLPAGAGKTGCGWQRPARAPATPSGSFLPPGSSPLLCSRGAGCPLRVSPSTGQRICGMSWGAPVTTLGPRLEPLGGARRCDFAPRKRRGPPM